MIILLLNINMGEVGWPKIGEYYNIILLFLANYIKKLIKKINSC